MPPENLNIYTIHSLGNWGDFHNASSIQVARERARTQALEMVAGAIGIGSGSDSGGGGGGHQELVLHASGQLTRGADVYAEYACMHACIRDWCCMVRTYATLPHPTPPHPTLPYLELT